MAPKNDDPFSETLVFERQEDDKVVTRKIMLLSDFFFASNVPILSLRSSTLSVDDMEFSLHQAYRLRENAYGRGINALDPSVATNIPRGEFLEDYMQHVSKDKTYLPAGTLLLRRYFAEEVTKGFFQWYALRPFEQKHQKLSRVGLDINENDLTIAEVLKFSIKPNSLRFVPSVLERPSVQRKQMRELWGKTSPYLKRHMHDLDVWNSAFPSPFAHKEEKQKHIKPVTDISPNKGVA